MFARAPAKILGIAVIRQHQSPARKPLAGWREPEKRQ
jgi:hypothetical protein